MNGKYAKGGVVTRGRPSSDAVPFVIIECGMAVLPAATLDRYRGLLQRMEPNTEFISAEDALAAYNEPEERDR